MSTNHHPQPPPAAHDATMLTATRILRASWSNTLRLPKSTFPARPDAAATPEYLRRCTDDLYAWQQSERTTPGTSNGSKNEGETFTLHDGPPYANGPLHVGHALNKITKDLICRYQVGQGKKVNYIPGWDCHGLPIEIKALQAQKKDASTEVDAVSVREAARGFAEKAIEEQKRGFKEWAVMGDWDNAYRTMEKGYEVRQLEVFKEMFEKGLIYRQYKPVYWSPSSRTALAEAELEYDENHVSLAAYVRLPVQLGFSTDGLSARLSADFMPSQVPIYVAVWTTTPWTLPANKAIAVHNDMEYVLVGHADDEYREFFLVAKSRLAHYEEVTGIKTKVIYDDLHGSDLAGHLLYENPFQVRNGLQPVVHADFVSDTSGTGLVHMAPGHGMDDYHVCSALGIEAVAPVDDAGAFTDEAFPEQPELLTGKLVSDADKSGSKAVLKYLEEKGYLQASQEYRHKYPIDWRTKQPVIVRATAQWFANVDDIKSGSLKAIEEVNFIPETGRSRLESFIQGRTQWCISRQRAWGVPIPALYRVDRGEPEAVMDRDTIQHIINVIKERGINTWWNDYPDDPVWKPSHLEGSYVRGKDTMDVWFDSGTSWTLLPPQQDKPVADVYFEGTDQHRGWFQSSLLTHVATQDYSSGAVKAPYKTLITHGFTLDSEGRKMSKSLGNVISPAQIMSGELLPPVKRKKQKGQKVDPSTAGKEMFDSMGADALRLWVASSDYTRDVTIGQPVLASVNKALHKYRVTFKWLLGIFSLPSCPPTFTSFESLRTYNFTYLGKDSEKQLGLAGSIPLGLTDSIAMHRLSQISTEVHFHYAKYEFYKGINVINKYINNDLSAFYFETLKDRIYTGSLSDCQHIQHLLGAIFYELLKMLAPVVPLLVEEVWDHVPEALRLRSAHPARTVWHPMRDLKDEGSMTLANMFDKYRAGIAAAIARLQEKAREDKKLGSGLACDVELAMVPAGSNKYIEQFLCTGYQLDELAGLFVVSQARWAPQEYDRDEDNNDLEPEDYIAKPGEHMYGAEVYGAEGIYWSNAKGDGPGPYNGLNDGAWGTVMITVTAPSKCKCPRCWRYVAEAEDKLCQRCHDVVKVEHPGSL